MVDVSDGDSCNVILADLPGALLLSYILCAVISVVCVTYATCINAYACCPNPVQQQQQQQGQLYVATTGAGAAAYNPAYVVTAAPLGKPTGEPVVYYGASAPPQGQNYA